MNFLQDLSLIKLVVDKYFNFLEESGGNHFIAELIPQAMLDNSKVFDDEYAYWVPIKSTVSEKDITSLEDFFGHSLPGSFVFFLQQRHFMELQLGSHDINFFSILPGEVPSKFRDIIDMFYWTLLERNFLPFAHVSDWGVLCFDANGKSEGNDYPVVMLDHEDGYDEHQVYSKNFQEMFIEFNSHLDDRIKYIREKENGNPSQPSSCA